MNPTHSRLPFSQICPSPRPAPGGLRLLLALCAGILAWQVPPWGALGTLLAAGILFRWNGMPLIATLRGMKNLWFLVTFPLLMDIAGFLVRGLPMGTEGAFRSLTLLALLLWSNWLGACMGIPDIRRHATWLFRIFGPGAARVLGTTTALSLAFLPWVFREARTSRDAMALRGTRGNPARQLGLFGTGLLVRLLGRTALAADALELRGTSPSLQRPRTPTP